MGEPAGSGRSATAVPVEEAQDTVALLAISWRYGVVRQKDYATNVQRSTISRSGRGERI